MRGEYRGGGGKGVTRFTPPTSLPREGKGVGASQPSHLPTYSHPTPPLGRPEPIAASPPCTGPPLYPRPLFLCLPFLVHAPKFGRAREECDHVKCEV
jgi:hypothetical protein